MEAFRVWTGVAAPLMRPNIDTDAIIPSREMKRVSKAGLGEGLFAGERYIDQSQRQEDPEFVLNRPEFANSSILIAGPNFGCGSSREHAVWALSEFGIRAIIAPSFGAIFANNCVRNGLLPVTLEEGEITRLANWVLESPAENQLLIDLDQQFLEAGSKRINFEIESGARHMLLNGLDAIALTMSRWEAIEAFDEARRRSRSWLYSKRCETSS